MFPATIKLTPWQPHDFWVGIHLISKLKITSTCSHAYTQWQHWQQFSSITYLFGMIYIYIYIYIYSTLPIYRGLSSPNNSRMTPIARPLGRGMGVFRESLIWPKFPRSNLVYIVLYGTVIYRESIVYGTHGTLMYRHSMTCHSMLGYSEPCRYKSWIVWVFRYVILHLTVSFQYGIFYPHKPTELCYIDCAKLQNTQSTHHRTDFLCSKRGNE